MRLSSRSRSASTCSWSYVPDGAPTCACVSTSRWPTPPPCSSAVAWCRAPHHDGLHRDDRGAALMTDRRCSPLFAAEVRVVVAGDPAGAGAAPVPEVPATRVRAHLSGSRRGRRHLVPRRDGRHRGGSARRRRLVRRPGQTSRFEAGVGGRHGPGHQGREARGACSSRTGVEGASRWNPSSRTAELGRPRGLIDTGGGQSQRRNHAQRLHEHPPPCKRRGERRFGWSTELGATLRSSRSATGWSSTTPGGDAGRGRCPATTSRLEGPR